MTASPTAVDAAALVERLLRPGCPSFALLRRSTPGRDPGIVEVLLGPVTAVERLADIPLPTGTPRGGGPALDSTR